ncbi:MAG: hypothetical protein U5K53_04280 [Halanaerobiales bacterium]|jgi:uncharacterized membrane protein|nr:hypothetical protein [Halanaerobiales bacterium]
MEFFIILFLGMGFYYLYKEGIINLSPKKDDEETKAYVLKEAKKKYENNEISKDEYEKIRNDIGK